MCHRDLKASIRDIPIIQTGDHFKDITTLLKDRGAFVRRRWRFWTISKAAARSGGRDRARGFIFGGALAHALGCGFIPMRKPGKLPGRRSANRMRLIWHRQPAEHEDAVLKGQRVALVDDLLATGGTSRRRPSWSSRPEECQRIGVVIELGFLEGATGYAITMCTRSSLTIRISRARRARFYIFNEPVQRWLR